MSKVIDGGEYNGLSWAVTDDKKLILGRDGENQVCDRRGQEFDERDVIDDSWSSWAMWEDVQESGFLVYNKYGDEKDDRDYYDEAEAEYDELDDDWPWIMQTEDWTEYIGAESRVWVKYVPVYPIDEVVIKGNVTLKGDLSSLFNYLELDDYPKGYENLMIETYDGEVLNYKEYKDRVRESAEKYKVEMKEREDAKRDKRNELREQGLTDEEIDAKEKSEQEAALAEQNSRLKNLFYEKRKPIFLNGVSNKCVRDYTTKAGDSDNYVKVSLPFGENKGKTSWVNMILSKDSIKDSKNPNYKNIMIYDIETYPILLDGDKRKIKGSMLKFKFDLERDKSKSEQKEISPEEPQGGDEKTDDKVLE